MSGVYVQRFCGLAHRGCAWLPVAVLVVLQAHGAWAADDATVATPPPPPSARSHVRPASAVLIVRGGHDYPPYCYLDADGKPTGFMVELFREVADQVNLKADIRLMPWDQVRQEFQQGRVDVVLGMIYSRERDAHADFSIRAAAVTYAVFVRRDSDVHSLADLDGKTVVVQRDDIAQEQLSRENVRLVGVQEMEEALRLVSRGRYEAAVLPHLPGLHVAEEKGLDNLKAVGGPLWSQDLCLAVQEGDTGLLGLLNEGLHLVDATGRYTELRQKWLGVADQANSERVGRIVRIAGVALTVLGAIVVAALMWSWTLRRRVRARTAELRTELAERRRAEDRIHVQRDLAVAMGAETEADHAMRACLAAAMRVSDLDCGGVYVPDAEGVLTLAISEGVSQWFGPPGLPLAPAAWGERLLQEGRPVFTRCDRIGNEGDPRAAEEGLEALAALPILHEMQRLGCLVLASHLLEEVPAPVRDALEAVAATLGATLARIEAGRELRRLEEQHRLVIENANESILVTQDDRICFANPKAEEVSGYTPAEMSARPFVDFVHPEDRAEVLRVYAKPLAGTGRGDRATFRIVRKDGEPRWVEVNSAAIAWRGSPASLHFLSDVTDRVQAEETLRRQALMFATVHDAVIVTDIDGRILNWNPGAERMFGYSREEALGELTSFLHHPDQAGHLSQDIRESVEATGQWTGEVPFIRKDGTRGVCETSVVPLRDARGNFVARIGVNRDITQRKQTEERLRQSEQRYRSLFEGVRDGFVLCRALCDRRGTLRDFELIEANPAFGELLDAAGDALEGKTLGQLAPRLQARLIETHASLAQPGQTAHFELFDEESDRYFEVSAYRPGEDRFATVIRDVSDRRRLEGQLRQAEKLTAVGQLAGGIAHDFNNILTAIQGNAELLRMDVPDDSEAGDMLSQIVLATRRAADLTGQLLAFARKGKFRTVTMDVHAIVTEVVSILSHSVDRRIEIHTALCPGEAMIEGDPSQIQNALMNLALNARDAMPHGGRLEFATEIVERKDGTGAEPPPALPAGRYVRIRVTDTGTGMDRHTRQHIFEPFFTTKEVGKGTGLGLASVYGCVRSHLGAIEVDSEIGHGTTFTVLLPLAGAAPQPAAKPTATPAQQAGHGHILLVDDEEIVRNYGSRVLRSMGYQVSTCRDGAEAVAFYRDHHERIDLVILDVIMPRMDGREALTMMREIHPKIRAVFSSGYSRKNVLDEDYLDGVVAFLDKPFSVEELARVVAECLPHARTNPSAKPGGYVTKRRS